MYSSSSKVKLQLNHQSLSIAGYSKCRDCCKVLSICSLNSSLKLRFSKCFPVKKLHAIYLLCFFHQSGICSLSTTGKLEHLPCPSEAYRHASKNPELLSLAFSMELLKYSFALSFTIF